jgi:very-short-patch-repair endonuclease
MKRIAKPIETKNLCSYGCGFTAKFINGSNKLMCSKSHNSCPALKKKNSIGLLNSERDYRETYKNLPQEIKDKMNWSKGLTKNTNDSVAKMAKTLKGKPKKGKPHSQQTKDYLSRIRTEWLKNPQNRKNLGRHKRSWMELIFEKYLSENNIIGWNTEVHFWNDQLQKNYFVDFLFDDKKLIIELDGTQHRKTVEKDKLRDNWFSVKGYKVIRISIEEFKKRFFTKQGFLDLIGH